MKYFFLSDSWTTGRVWEFGGLWNEIAWNRPPHLQRQTLYIRENGENLWLYQAEDAILMVEVMPKSATHHTIGQVVLKRLLSAEQVVERLCQEKVFHPTDAELAPDNLSHANELSAANTQHPALPSAHQPTPAYSPQKRWELTAVMNRIRKLTGGKERVKSPAGIVS